MDAQADRSLRWAHMPFCWIFHVAAQYAYSEGSNHTEQQPCLISLDSLSASDCVDVQANMSSLGGHADLSVLLWTGSNYFEKLSFKVEESQSGSWSCI